MIKRVLWFTLVACAVALSVMLWTHGANSILLNPKGWVGLRERDIMLIATFWMLLIIIPTICLSIWITWKYRADNKKAEYHPTWDKSLLAETIWWGVPCIIVAILSWITWETCIELDPFRPLESNVKPVRIQVVALQWRWLFLYPEHGVASLNAVEFPEKTPIQFEITADAPMNSFWIPQLGGQIYAMPAMETKLHLIANEVGSYTGSSANLSGTGFASMRFIAHSRTQEDFDAWVGQSTSNGLTWDDYVEIAKPSTDSKPAVFYRLDDSDLFHKIIMKYMMGS
jgi:cytochrome o ubiquinol oxidase subunit 2